MQIPHLLNLYNFPPLSFFTSARQKLPAQVLQLHNLPPVNAQVASMAFVPLTQRQNLVLSEEFIELKDSPANRETDQNYIRISGVSAVASQ